MKNIQGWINLYKPKNLTSFKAINQLKKKFSIEVFSNIKMISKKLPEIIQKFDATLDYQSNKDQKKFSKTIIVLTFLYLSTITYLIFK